MKKLILALSVSVLLSYFSTGQTIKFEDKDFELKNVTGSVVQFQGKKVLKIERDLKALPFDANNLEATVDNAQYARLADTDFENGTIEVKVFAQIQNPSPFQAAQGFIGLAYRIAPNDTAFESIYLRPKVGRSDNQAFRNHTVQYFAYPNFKFATLRNIAPEMYETSAPVNINEWITMRIEVSGEKAELFINDAKYSTMIVNKMKGSSTHGSIGLWVDIGTIGFFRDLKITKR